MSSWDTSNDFHFHSNSSIHIAASNWQDYIKPFSIHGWRKILFSWPKRDIIFLLSSWDIAILFDRLHRFELGAIRFPRIFFNSNTWYWDENKAKLTNFIELAILEFWCPKRTHNTKSTLLPLHFDLSQKAEKRCWISKCWVKQTNENKIRFCKLLSALGSSASGRLFPTSRLRFAPKSVWAQFFAVNRLPALPSQPALLCWFSQMRVWREENVSPRGRPAYSPTIAQESTQRALVSSTLGFAFLMKIFTSHFIICCFFTPHSSCAKPIFCRGKKSIHKFYLNAGFNNPLLYPMCRHTQALHTYRINLSPFTKDFRVWGAPIET